AGTVGFVYDLLTVFAQADVASLKAFLQGKKIDLRVDAWYGDPVVAGATPIPYANAPSVAMGVVRSVQGDFDPPTVALTGMMGSTRPITSSKTKSGTAADTGGSHLSQVQVSWAPAVGGSVLSTAVYTPLAPYYFLDSSGQATLDSGSFSVNLVDANGNPLPDGWYAIQVVASDGAGNTWNNGGVAVVKVIDTTAPT